MCGLILPTRTRNCCGNVAPLRVKPCQLDNSRNEIQRSTIVTGKRQNINIKEKLGGLFLRGGRVEHLENGVPLLFAAQRVQRLLVHGRHVICTDRKRSSFSLAFSPPFSRSTSSDGRTQCWISFNFLCVGEDNIRASLRGVVLLRQRPVLLRRTSQCCASLGFRLA